MKIVFMGTPEFAVPSLERINEKYGVNVVLTQPDKPKGRGKKLSMSPVKEYALKNNIEVIQPKNIKKDIGTIKHLKSLDLDIIIVVAYGQILSKEILDIPKYGCINLHASLLPKYRGAAPINWAIINGEKVTGNTTMLMEEGLDTGDILLNSVVNINSNMTAGELHDILMIDGAVLLDKTINGIFNKTIRAIKQDHSKTCYAQMLNKDIAKINWGKKSLDIKNFVNGLNPWPVAYTYYKEKMMKVYEVDILKQSDDCCPGKIIDVNKEGVKVSSKDNIILIKKIQFPGKKILTVEEYLRGNNIETGILLT